MSGRNIIAAVCVIGAVVISVNRADGWGWLLFIAFCAVDD